MSNSLIKGYYSRAYAFQVYDILIIKETERIYIFVLQADFLETLERQ